MKIEFIGQEDLLKSIQNGIENKTEIMGYDSKGNFLIYKKCLILFNRTDSRFSYDPTEIFIPINTYYILKSYVEQTGSHYIPESEVHWFFSYEDFWNTMIEAQKNKLF